LGNLTTKNIILKKEFNIELKKLKTLLNQTRKILLVSHYNPDGDAIGSILALYHYLNKKGHSVTLLVPNDFPEFLKWMPDSDQIMVYFRYQKTASRIIKESEVIICADFNDVTRLKDLGPKLATADAVKVLIDHHPNPDDIYKILFNNTKASSTAELVYEIICNSGDRRLIDSKVAECIYCGIMTDTGCFSFNSSRPETFNVVADLLKCGINKDKIFNLIYDNFSYNRMKLLGYCLNKKMVVLQDLHTAYIYITGKELEKFHFKSGDTEGFVNLPFSIEGVNITALFLEKKKDIRISMRSRGGFAVNEFCRKYFEGGGHKNAAGGESHLPMKKTIEKFKKLLELYRHEIKTVQWFGD
jgi:bifunctional oligoribonuclease and PAP phosphatase NrnA